MKIVTLDLDPNGEVDVFKIFELLAENDMYGNKLRVLVGNQYAKNKWESFDELVQDFVLREGIPCEGNLIIIDTEEKTVERTRYVVDTVEKETRVINIEKTLTIGEGKTKKVD